MIGGLFGNLCVPLLVPSTDLLTQKFFWILAISNQIFLTPGLGQGVLDHHGKCLYTYFLILSSFCSCIPAPKRILKALKKMLLYCLFENAIFKQYTVWVFSEVRTSILLKRNSTRNWSKTCPSLIFIFHPYFNLCLNFKF